MRIEELPPAQPSLIAYPYSLSARFPTVNGGGGRTIMAGPVYYFDEGLAFKRKLPREFNHTLFIYDWSRNWIIAVHLNAREQIAKMERFCSGRNFGLPIDFKLGPVGCLYLIESGSDWSDNLDSQIVRIEFAE